MSAHCPRTHYYHAGVDDGRGGVWSDHTRRSFEAAAHEARAMARERGAGRPVVECWARRYGLRPGDCELVEGASFVDDLTDATEGE